MKKFVRSLSVMLCAVLLCTAFSACMAPEEPSSQAEGEEPCGKVRGKVLSDNGDMMICGILVTSESGASRRLTTNAYGGYYLELPPGTYTLTFDKGIEFSTHEVTVTVESLKTYYLQDVRLNQLCDSYANGWIAGDVHQHSTYSDGSDSIEQLVIANASAGLYWGFLTDHNTSRGVPEWRESSGVSVLTDANGARRFFHGFAGVEATTEFGHFNSLGTGMTFDKYEINFTEAERSSAADKKNAAARDKIIYIAQQIERQGGLAQMNHPYSLTNMGAMNFLAADDFEVFECFSTMEIWNAYFVAPDGRFTVENSDNQNYRAKLIWYSTLNRVKDGGKFIAAVSATDNHDSTGPVDAATAKLLETEPADISAYQTICRYRGKYSGSPALYAYLGGEEISQENIMAAVKAGHSYMTNGPVMDVKIGEAVFGDTVEAENGSVTLSVRLFCRDGMESFRIVRNGETVSEKTLGGASSCEDELTVSAASGDWILVEVLGEYGLYAISNPFFVAEPVPAE